MARFPIQLSRAEPAPFAPFAAFTPDEKASALPEQWKAITAHKWLILGFAAIVALLTTVYAYRLTPIYRSTAVVLIEAAKPRVLSIEDVYSGSTTERGNYLTQVEILKSREVAARTVKALRLWEVAEFDPRKLGRPWAEVLGLSPRSGSTPAGWSDSDVLEGATDLFLAAVSIDPVRLSSLVRVSFDSRDKDLAARGANELIRTYINIDRETRANMSQSAAVWLQGQIASMRTKLGQSEQALQSYRERNGLISVNGSTQNLSNQQVGEVAMRQLNARAKRIELESAYQQIRGASGADLSSIPAVARDPGVLSARRAAEAAQAKVAELSERYGSNHSSIIEARIQLKAARDSLDQQIQSTVKALAREYEAALATERSLSANVGSARDSAQDVNRQEFRLAELERDVQANKQLYEMLVTRSKETSIGNETQGAIARLVDPATVSRTPVKPQKATMIVMATLAALVAASLVPLIFSRFDTSLKSVEEAEARLGYPVLACLPPLKGPADTRGGAVFLDKPRSFFSESIRTARTSVLLSLVDSSSKILVVTSSHLEEGKSTLSTNLAIAHAQTRRTLLIDADMRRPSVARRLGLSSSAKGLSNLVSGTADLRECMHFVTRANLWVVPAGELPPNPLELLLSQRFRECLTALTRQFEIILIDTPPVELVSDALVLAPLANGVIFVVKATSTPHTMARKGLMKVQRTGANIIGTVLNQLEPAIPGSRSKNGSYYGTYGAESIYEQS